MITFIVNNDVHYMRARLIRDQIHHCDSQARFHLVKFLPSALTMTEADHLYDRIYESRGLFGSFWQLLNLKIEKKIKQNLDRVPFAKGDILFLFTEYELGNHYLVQRAKQAGARVFIVDEGIGTYIINNYPNLSAGSSVKQRVIGEVTQWIQHFTDSRRLTGNGSLYFPVLKDTYYDGYILFYNFPLKRSMPLIYLQYPEAGQEIPNLDPDAVIILGEGLHRYHISEQEYIDSLLAIIRSAARNFRHVYFKFHRCETAFQGRPLYQRLQDEMQIQGVRILDAARPEAIENIIPDLDFPPRFVVSYLCTALFNLYARGCQPIFTCQLIQERDEDFEVVKDLLSNVGYNLIRSYNDISPDYSTHLSQDRIFPADRTVADFYRSLN